MKSCPCQSRLMDTKSDGHPIAYAASLAELQAAPVFGSGPSAMILLAH